MLLGAENGLLARGTNKGRSSVRGEWDRGKLVGRKRTRNGLLGGTSGAEVSWLGADGIFFSFMWRGWGAQRPDALLASDVRALAVPFEFCLDYFVYNSFTVFGL